MSITSGFFDALETSNGVFDRTYSSADYCDNLATIINNGVRYSSEDDLLVTAPGEDMTINIAPGRAWINGHYVFNDTDYEELTVNTAPTGIYSRIDRVVARLDTSITGRAITFAIVTGTASETPAAPALTRSGDIYEICLAEILVNAGVTAITNDMITDTRADGTVCGWAASVTPAIMSLQKQYVYNEVLTENTTTLTFSIPQFNADVPQIVNVYRNGALMVEGVDYTRNADTITFAVEQTTGTRITVVLSISVDTTGITSVVDEITDLQDDVAEIQNALVTLEQDEEYIYHCNGATDNVQLSEIAQAWLSGGTDYATKKIRIVGGNIGVTAANAGTGTASDPFTWFNLGLSASTNRRIIFDFSNAGALTIPIAAGTYNTIFAGADITVIGANVIANQTEANTAITIFNDSTGAIYAESCRFWINSTLDSVIATNGTFGNCRGSIAVNGGNAYCFNPAATGVVRVFGGEYYAYTYANSDTSAVLEVDDNDAVGILYAVNCPQVSRTGYEQTYAIHATAGKVSITDTITTLTITASVANIRGTLAVNKPGLM